MILRVRTPDAVRDVDLGPAYGHTDNPEGGSLVRAIPGPRSHHAKRTPEQYARFLEWQRARRAK